MSAKLTALIPCKNERANIRACIESVRPLADEILVADSGSTDGTLDIVRRTPGCRLIEREFIGFSSFKNWAIPQARHPWVLIVDADERVSPRGQVRIVLVEHGRVAVPQQLCHDGITDPGGQCVRREGMAVGVGRQLRERDQQSRSGNRQQRRRQPPAAERLDHEAGAEAEREQHRRVQQRGG